MSQNWITFCQKDPVTVAKNILGAYLIRETSEGIIKGRIVEVEAYGGFHDAGSHISKGVTARTKIMLDTPGLAYVYIIYGMYHCLNLVAHTENQAGAVLIRAVEPLEGLEIMKQRRGLSVTKNVCNGPGKLCQAFGITKADNGHLLSEQPLYIVKGAPLPEEQVAATPRVNIDYAGEAKEWLWRFYIKDNPYISRK